MASMSFIDFLSNYKFSFSFGRIRIIALIALSIE